MKNTLLTFLLLMIGIEVIGQDTLPVIKATSEKVDIRVGDEYFIKGGWALNPNKKPDVFSIGSKWAYEGKKVTFTTNIDSISFNVNPGNKYNFIIILNDTVSCYTQIKTLSNPVFLKKSILIPILIGILLILFLLYLYRQKINTIKLLYLGYASALLFWIITFLGGFIHGNYNHLKNVISDLGAIETKSEIFTSASLILLSVLCILFSIGFYRASRIFKISIIPAILSFSMPISVIWAAIFPLGNEFHSSTSPLPFLIILGSLLSFLLWKKTREFSELRLLSIISFFVMLLISLRFIKPFGYQYEGLIQRFFYLGWTIWTLIISYYFIKRLQNQELKIVKTDQTL
jgi:hypothetical membrane protein